MEIGVVKEIKDREFRVGLSPDSVKVLSRLNNEQLRVFLEQDF